MVAKPPAAASSIPQVSEQDFEPEILRSELPVLIFFSSERSTACKTVTPEVEAVARELAGKVKVVKVDIDRAKRIATSLRIQGVPMFMVFAKGRPVAAEQGVLMRAHLRDMVDPFLPRAEGAVRAAELAQLIKEGQVVAVDTREATSYGRARIPGAVNLPLDEIEGRLAELHMLQGAPILYCRAGDKTKELADRLSEGGMPVGFLEGGFLAWEAEALPIERPD